ncbi:hypothetical protein [Bradyrhizobium sp.]|uniref:hypothetical protein n=1 Tax=Bradyrhizobium sp. TaxID=376 RepID=UPI001D8D1593|nr:hypothetical protein [Bradyrhizobium sp.]MBI5319645.1 hypothetical protein [Bradyrhizobium sp.]
MAKNSDHLAGLEAQDTGGLFSSLLAEEDGYDRRRTLWRVASWGVGSVAALVIAVMANQASLGWRRDQAATADLVQQANRLQAATRESQNEARRLASAVETLNSDRDRLYTRVTVLEQGLDSVTGAIARQNAPVVASAQPDAQPAVQAPAPVIAPVATKPAAQGERAAAAASAEPSPASTSAIKDVATRPAAMPATPLVETKSMMAPPDPAAGKLIETSKPASAIATEPIPAVVAAAPPGESAEQDAADAALPKVQRTEFGVDVGGANSIAGLRALWRGLLKSRSNAPLAALQPLIVIREGSGGRGMQLRLVAGPLGDAAAAAKICAVLIENDRDCETAVYDGQRLALKAEDAPPAAAKPAVVAPPATRKKNAAQKRAAAEEPAKKPEAATSSSWSSFFSGKKN